ncbi:PTS glucitol/sorbitol transporter subunit IIC [Clostridioides sp. ES-S-0108-01]|uniref:PTS glucitol/sorbitol transporter subunit IIC n=1 Tax=unclassified Clostridioides TaxID=2635829 RepID=UPI001D0C2586|nr:PTS glucitol/sorbitol transporter subunit IIC [Clostridioides sp. ES-S-0171-01]MCC0687698.1 PTS glucitol/sorbitol transporter subunit IIC [Clostridioides sp. ES-S-0056-01]MCC0714793.1 PTS glucitol/sorbitol transporter subunit IIC [Clostridioides sp. ES-S-0077-01]MCC0781594.1 PTS glucitol/sorbitol transporter subunit IIC [Clostridioides sp. ES-S-0108-01]UDN50100.1 PTS glucitol/sorbitol transporter subunit IIC [Clostridioides sp. ES-S-0107-01]UDN53567.1 PTS glucitol/sorbitol transporter subun
MENVITGLSKGAEWFIGLFQKGGEQFVGLVSGTLPTLIVLMVAINSLIKIIGEERVNNWASKLGKNSFTRYILLPLVSVFFLGNPMCYTFGRFLKEEHKAGFYDAAVSFVHPITGLFPHANAGELFVWLGISAGLTTLGKETTTLALWYFIVGLIVIFIRGIITEKMYAFLTRKNKVTNKA